MKQSTVIPFPVLYRGFCTKTEDIVCKSEISIQTQELIIRHKRVKGVWFTGYYMYTESTDQHWITDPEKGFQAEVLPETIGLLEPNSGHFSGDVCYFQEEIRGILYFGPHKDSNRLNREEVSFYIDWQGQSITAEMLRQDLLFWAKSKDVTWIGTKWDPKSKRLGV